MKILGIVNLLNLDQWFAQNFSIGQADKYVDVALTVYMDTLVYLFLNNFI